MTLILMKLFLDMVSIFGGTVQCVEINGKPLELCRTRRNSTGCPVCARKKQAKSRQKTFLQSGVKTLNQTNPELVVEWNYEKNGDLNPEFITAGSGKSVWWKCKNCGYEWQAEVVERVRGQKKCKR